MPALYDIWTLSIFADLILGGRYCLCGLNTSNT